MASRVEPGLCALLLIPIKFVEVRFSCRIRGALNSDNLPHVESDNVDNSKEIDPSLTVNVKPLHHLRFPSVITEKGESFLGVDEGQASGSSRNGKLD